MGYKACEFEDIGYQHYLQMLGTSINYLSHAELRLCCRLCPHVFSQPMAHSCSMEYMDGALPRKKVNSGICPKDSKMLSTARVQSRHSCLWESYSSHCVCCLLERTEISLCLCSSSKQIAEESFNNWTLYQRSFNI